MSDPGPDGRGRIQARARRTWSALMRRSRPEAQPARQSRVRPQLARDPEGNVLLVEGERARDLGSAPVRDALARALGPPRADAWKPMLRREESPAEVELVLPHSVDAVLAYAPPDSVATADDIAGGSSRVAGGDPERGTGALDRLALARARGITHLLVPTSEPRFLQQSPELANHLARRATIVACNDAATMWALTPAPAPGPPKVFAIGLNKTGTTSLHLAFEQLGLRSFHWGGRRAYHAVLHAQRDGERLLLPVGEGYDAYSDVETLSVRFDLADLQYPGSRFVLTVRDVDDWVESRRRHAERNRRGIALGSYSGANVGIDEDAWRVAMGGTRRACTDVVPGPRQLAGARCLRGRRMGAPGTVPRPSCAGDAVSVRQCRRRIQQKVPRVARPPTPTTRRNFGVNGFEKRITSAWRSVRRHLPPKLAESVRVPVEAPPSPRRPDQRLGAGPLASRRRRGFGAGRASRDGSPVRVVRARRFRATPRTAGDPLLDRGVPAELRRRPGPRVLSRRPAERPLLPRVHRPDDRERARLRVGPALRDGQRRSGREPRRRHRRARSDVRRPVAFDGTHHAPRHAHVAVGCGGPRDPPVPRARRSMAFARTRAVAKHQRRRTSIDAYVPRRADPDYVFFTAWPWAKHPEVNPPRVDFIEACRRAPGLTFEGGFAPRRRRDVPEVLPFSTTGRTPIGEYLDKVGRSAVAFNNPAVHGCLGWKLGEFLALGKAIISLPITPRAPGTAGARSPSARRRRLTGVARRRARPAPARSVVPAHPRDQRPAVVRGQPRARTTRRAPLADARRGLTRTRREHRRPIEVFAEQCRQFRRRAPGTPGRGEGSRAHRDRRRGRRAPSPSSSRSG